MSKKKPLEIDMIAGSQLRDTQGEMLSVEGADISDLIMGRGRFNDNHGKGFYNSIGRVTGARKIFKKDDCTNDREHYYWDKVKAPFIYVKGHLYDDEDHPNARAAAAILRNVHKADAPLKIKASVEGGVISRGVSDQSLLARTKIHSVALTFTPANNATLVEPTSLDKSSFDEAADMELIKSVAHLAETNVPSFRHITRHAQAGKVISNIEKIQEIADALGLSKSDLPVFEKDELIKHALEAKILNNVKKINELAKQISQQDLEKGLKHKIAAAATAGALAYGASKLGHVGGYKQGTPEYQSAYTEHMKDMGATVGTDGKMVAPKDKDLRLMQVEAGYKASSQGHPRVNKALMAGYGGAGAPTGQTGGSVIQSESLEDGRSFKHIGCDSCGKEQVYHKHQVKCRSCNSSFPLEKLYGLIVSKK